MHPFNLALHRKAAKRAKRFAALRKRGFSYVEIALRERISRQRVTEILKRNGG